MRPIGILSIPRSQTPDKARKFDILMGAAGFNTGNLLFTNAVWAQVKGRKKRLGFHFDPDVLNKTLEALVIPAANWLGPHVDLSELADLVEKLDIPVILIGIGAQDHAFTGTVEIPDGTLRFVRAVSERSHSISVRGEYTREILAGYGVQNVTVTGCPSLYQSLQPDAEAKLRAAWASPAGPTLLHSTRYSAAHLPFIETPSVHRDIFRHAYASGTDLLLQSEPEEISMIVQASGKPVLDDGLKAAMVELYQAQDWTMLENYLRRHAKVFFDTVSWSESMTGYGRAFGTRLHATIMALNSGVPAILVHHDSRTREMSKFAGLPSISADQACVSDAGIQDCFRAADLETYFLTRRTNMKVYAGFLAGNGLKPEIDSDISVHA